MTESDWLADRFQENRAHLRAVAYRMLGSPGEADDALQEAWLRLTRSDADKIQNLGGWLTTVVARVCLDMLRSRKTRREEPIDEALAPPSPAGDPAQEAQLADSVGSALLLVLRTLTPAERVAFVLHDLFDRPFEEVASTLGRSPAAVRQLASRARRRVRGGGGAREDQAQKRAVVTAFLAASREGRFEDLMRLLDPGIRLYADDTAVKTAQANQGRGAPPFQNEMRGAQTVAETFQGRATAAQLALINGSIGTTWVVNGRPRVAMLFFMEEGKIQEINVVMDAEDLREMEVTPLEA